MRSSILIALSAALALCVATQASATSSLRFKYLGGSSVAGGQPCDGGPSLDCVVNANPGDVLQFALTMTIDSEGLAAYNFDYAWDQDGEDQLDLVSSKARASLTFVLPNPTPPPDTLSLSYVMVAPDEAQESEIGQEGHIYGYEAIGPPPPTEFATNVSFRVGVVKMEATGNASVIVGHDMELGFFTGFVGGNGFALANLDFVTPDFATATVNVPEPGTTLLIGASLSALALLALRSRRED